MPVTVGLQHAGSFQVAGWPYLNDSELDINEKEFQFDFISQEITVWNAGGNTLKFYFVSGSDAVFELPAGKKVTMRVKAGSIFAKSEAGTTIKLFVSMTNIPLHLIGTIPTGSYFGPVDPTDTDGDGIPDVVDENPELFDLYGVGNPLADPYAVGTNDLWLEYDNGADEFIVYDSEAGMGVIPDTIVFLPNEEGECASVIIKEDFDPLFLMLTAHYYDDDNTPPTKETFEFDHDLHNQVSLLPGDYNQVQILTLTVSRTYGLSLTATVTVGIPIMIQCPLTTPPSTGEFLEGSFELSQYEYPCDENICIDPECWDAEFWEED